jgi:hypothetical protein
MYYVMDPEWRIVGQWPLIEAKRRARLLGDGYKVYPVVDEVVRC